jgi:hypothetical protein
MNKSLDYTKNEYFQLKVYELYFIKHITNHFERVYKFIVKKEEIFLSNIKFKNMYVIDLSTNDIIFDILSFRVISFKNRNQKKINSISKTLSFGKKSYNIVKFYLIIINLMTLKIYMIQKIIFTE